MHSTGIWSASARSLAFAICTLLVAFLFSGCDYARMKEDEALRTYERIIPEMPLHTIPMVDGLDRLRQADPKSLQNPLAFNDESIGLGRERYWSGCVHCHGPETDGHGTVGQSFAPLPTNLKDATVQQQSDGELFHKTAFGFKRHPPLVHTLSEGDIWAVIHYLRFLAKHPLS